MDERRDTIKRRAAKATMAGGIGLGWLLIGLLALIAFAGFINATGGPHP